MKLARINHVKAAILGLMLTLPCAQAQFGLLTWSANTETNLAGYQVYISDANTAYPSIDVKLETSHLLTNLNFGVTYWVYVTAYNTNGFESDPSIVIQFPEKDCQYALQPSSTSVSPWPTYGVFRVVTDSTCTWSLFSNDEWIEITSVTTGIGMQEVSYLIHQNTQPFPRQGSITVADRTFVVHQSAAGVQPVVTSSLPSTLNVREGELVELSIEATDPSELRYQWYQNGDAFFDATGNYLVIPSVRPDHAGLYTVTVSNAVSSVSVGPVQINVYPLPVIESDPQSTSVAAGQPIHLSVTAAGPDLRYSWFKNGLPLQVHTRALVIPSAALADSGSYSVNVSNLAGAVSSAAATVTVFPAEQWEGRVVIKFARPGQLQVHGAGIPGSTYTLEASLDFKQWFVVRSFLVDAQGRYGITNETSAQRIFFRSRRH